MKELMAPKVAAARMAFPNSDIPYGYCSKAMGSKHRQIYCFGDAKGDVIHTEWQHHNDCDVTKIQKKT